MSSRLVAAGAAALISAALLIPSDAQAKQCRPGGHLHHGASDGQPSKSDARRDAIASWSSFTELEYGSSWANFKNARYKKISCYDTQSGWACNVEGNPCKSRRRRTARR